MTGFRFYIWICILITLAACQRTEVSKTDASKPKPATLNNKSKTPSEPNNGKASVPPNKKASQTTSSQKPSTTDNPPQQPKPKEVVNPPNDKAAGKKSKEGESTIGVTPGRVLVSPNYDEELRKIVDLARRHEWEDAEARASALYALEPKDPAVERVYKWVQTEGPKYREKVLEDKIRDTNSRDTRFNPTVGSILSDKKFQGLPPRSDLREAIEQLKAQPYIPSNFGRTTNDSPALLDLQTAKSKMSELLEKPVSIKLTDVTLKDIIFTVGRQQNISFIAEESIPAYQQKITINMEQGKIGEFLQFVSQMMGVQFQIGDNLIWILDGKDTNTVLQTTRVFRLKHGFVLPAKFAPDQTTRTITTPPGQPPTMVETEKPEFFVHDNAPANPSLDGAIKKFYTGKFQIDYEHNQILARGTDAQLKLLEQIIETFDQPLKQVLIEARFITVTEATFLKLGVSWETGRDPLSFDRTATDYTGLAENVGLGLQESWMGVLGQDSLSATLTAIDQSGESETLSAPRLTVINNLPATFSDGITKYYYEEYRVTQSILEQRSSSKLVPTGKPIPVVTGVKLNVLASLGGDGQTINLALNPEVTPDVTMETFAAMKDQNEKGELTDTSEIKLPIIRTQSLSTRAIVHSGQTVVLGGVMQREQKTFVESVPVLSRIPILGAAFRRRTEVDRPRYLLVFVTATTLADNGQFIVGPNATK